MCQHQSKVHGKIRWVPLRGQRKRRRVFTSASGVGWDWDSLSPCLLPSRCTWCLSTLLSQPSSGGLSPHACPARQKHVSTQHAVTWERHGKLRTDTLPPTPALCSLICPAPRGAQRGRASARVTSPAPNEAHAHTHLGPLYPASSIRHLKPWRLHLKECALGKGMGGGGGGSRALRDAVLPAMSAGQTRRQRTGTCSAPQQPAHLPITTHSAGHKDPGGHRMLGSRSWQGRKGPSLLLPSHPHLPSHPPHTLILCTTV